MTYLQSALLMLLARRGPMTTLQILACSDEEELRDFWFLRGRIYRALDDLVSDGLVKREPTNTYVERGYLPRYVYGKA